MGIIVILLFFYVMDCKFVIHTWIHLHSLGNIFLATIRLYIYYKKSTTNDEVFKSLSDRTDEDYIITVRNKTTHT